MMNRINKISYKVLVLLMGAAVLLACNKKKLVDAPYPEAAVYLSQAAQAKYNMGGLYTVPANIYNQPVYYTIENGKLNIPVGVIRTGADLSGDVEVKLKAEGKDSTLFSSLPANSFSIVNAVNVKSGNINASVPLSIDLNFLINSFKNNPEAKYGLLVSIDAAGRPLTANLASVILVITPEILLKPVSDFFAYTYNDGSMTGYFVNKAINGFSYSWDFGDGSAPVNEALPAPHKYNAKGTYKIKLTVKGWDESIPESIKEMELIIM